MDIETARIFAESFSGVGEGATWAFIVWIFFDFLKELLPYTFFVMLFMIARRPVGRVVKAVFYDDDDEKERS